MDLSVTNYTIFQNFIYSNYTESATNFVNTFIPITGTIHLAGTRLMTPSPKKGWIFFGKPFGSPTIKLDFGLRGGALWAIFQKNLNRTFFWTMYQCCNEASKIFEASKIIIIIIIKKHFFEVHTPKFADPTPIVHTCCEIFLFFFCGFPKAHLISALKK